MLNINFAIIILLIILIFIYSLYATIIAKRNKVLEALSDVDTHLQKRLDSIPNILTVAKKFMEHEKETFNEISKLREGLMTNYNSKNPEVVKRHFEISEQLSSKMSLLNARSEAYPDLKSSQNMILAQQSYNEIEEQIVAARRFYNSAVGSLRNSIQIFPGNILASIMGIKDMPFYEAQESSHIAIDAGKFL